MSALDRGTRLIAAIVACLGITSIAAAQQRPLVTEDPETIGAGRVLVEFGVDHTKDQHFPVSGLTGDLWTVPNIGFSFGISSIAEIQIDGSPYQRLDITRREEAPLSSRVTASRQHHRRRRQSRHRHQAAPDVAKPKRARRSASASPRSCRTRRAKAASSPTS